LKIADFRIKTKAGIDETAILNLQSEIEWLAVCPGHGVLQFEIALSREIL